MNKYQENKEKVRQEAIEWQRDFEKYDYSYEGLAFWENYFYKKGKKYGLLKEFRENGIL